MRYQNSDSTSELRDRLNRETAKISWHELQKHYAAGSVMGVRDEADLIQVAVAFHFDDRTQVEEWLGKGTLFEVDDSRALKWYTNRAEHWAVVIPPFVLVQEVK
ncbi:MAG: DUF2288 domain-containing protein [Porticoccaceae bacterium]|nr:DUF2288 domain-containing protein [Porticoccaceae bacterium]